MNVTFYLNISEPNKIYKNISTVQTITDAQFRDAVNLITPEFVFESSLFDAKAVNYCYIDELKRWYFIDSVECIRTNIYSVKCRVDVLYTYRNSILAVSGLINRAEDNDYHNKYLKDDERNFEIPKYHIPINFTGSIATLTPKLILMTVCNLVDASP